MARIRSIKPEIFQSPQVMNVSIPAQLLFVGLITQADDEGRGVADPRKLKSAVFPGSDEVSSESILGFLDELKRERLCTLYASQEHGALYSLPSWNQHQKVEKPRKSNYPRPPRPVGEESGSAPGHIREESGSIPRGSDLIGEDLIGSDRRGSKTSGGSSLPSGSLLPTKRPSPRVHPPRKAIDKNGHGRTEEPEAERVRKAIYLLEAVPNTKIGEAARMYRVSVEAIEQARRT